MSSFLGGGGGGGSTGANPTATASDIAVNGVATTFMRSDAAPAVQLCSAAQFGLCEVDGSTITAAGGVISVAGGAGTVNSVTANDTTLTISPNTGAVLAQINLARANHWTNTTDSSSTATGAIVTDGGVGIAKNLYVGNNVNFPNSTGSTLGVIAWASGPQMWGFTNNLAWGSSTTGNHAGVPSGAESIAIGKGALAAQTTNSFWNVCIGVGAGAAITSGAQNICIGQGAGAAMTTATNTIAIGNNALNTGVCTADANVCIGIDTGLALTSGLGNVFIGKQAGKNASTNSDNVAIGRGAMFAASFTGVQNMAIGQGALAALTGGQQNVSVGVGGIAGITTGSNNTSIGYLCGANLTGGDSGNTFMGGGISGTAGDTNTVQIGDSVGGLRLDYGHTTAGRWTMSGNLTIPALSTAGVLVNDSSGNVSSDSTAAAATVSAAFIADHRLAVTIGVTTYYIAMSTTAW